MKTAVTNEVPSQSVSNQAGSSSAGAAVIEARATGWLEIARTVFERGEGYIDLRESIGLDAPTNKAVLTLLVKSYLDTGNIKFATRAAAKAKDPLLFKEIERQLATAEQAKGTRVGIEGILADFESKTLLIEIALGCKDASTRKRYFNAFIKQADVYSATALLRSSKDEKAILAFGKRLLKSYCQSFTKDKTANRIAGSTELLGGHAIELLGDVAKSRNKERRVLAAEKLIELGDFLLKENGQPAVNHERSSSSTDRLTPLKAYLASNSNKGHSKAAALYEVMAKGRQSVSTTIADLCTATELRIKAGQQDRAQGLISQIAERGDFTNALRLQRLGGGDVNLESVARLFTANQAGAVTLVRDKISDYLQKKLVDQPFPTHYTFWHFSDGNSEWALYAAQVDALSGRHVRHSQEREKPLAQSLYASEKYRSKITVIHKELQKHLVLGWLVSGLDFESKHGYSTDRKYKHAGYAAYRTFAESYHNSGYSPLPKDSQLPADPLMSAAWNIIHNFQEADSKLCREERGWKVETRESVAFRASNIKPALAKIRELYQQKTAALQELVKQLV